ncbi:hypothetical protein F5887DRAFT_1138275 [Amanita rubescens]|nr:hypothetical protein F5887DRAFT_1138275 [Amanita rubescens]
MSMLYRQRSGKNLYRAYKDASEWTRVDLDSYNIHVTPQDTASFFDSPSLPNPQVSAEILDVEEAVDMKNNDNVMLIELLDAAMAPSSEESAVIDFSAQLFRYLGGYIGGRRYPRTRKHLALPISGHTQKAMIDLCIIDGSSDHIVLIVEDHKRSDGSISDAEAKLVAKAIAAFEYNNECRKASSLPELDKKVMAGIIMTGTMPTFYEIPITLDLVHSVRHGKYSYQPTEVLAYYVPVTRQNRRWTEGMKPLGNRHNILSCYEAFKAIAGVN